jgi:hypothetical protein
MNQKTSFFKIHSIVRVCRYWGGIEVMFDNDFFTIFLLTLNPK